MELGGLGDRGLGDLPRIMQRAVLIFVSSTAGALLLYALGLMQMRKFQAVE